MLRTTPALLLMTLLSVPFLARAQSGSATLTGSVTDPQGAAVSGAAVILTEETKNLSRKATTNQEGQFVFTPLPPSRYRVRIEQPGFAVADPPVFTLNVSDQSSLRIELRLAARGDTLDVRSEAPLVSASPAVSTVIDRQFIENQPLNGRSFQSLVELSPGVTLAPSSLPTAGQFSVNGQRTSSNYFTVDGVSGNFGSTASVTLYESAGGSIPSYSALGTTSSLASVDAVQEFSIQTSTYAPEYGRQPGGQVSIVTRSGTNAWHGSVFDYLRNSALDANNFFANQAGLGKAPLRQNDFGFTLGGPVYLPSLRGRPWYRGRNRTFFLLSYEGARLRQPFVTEPLQVPSLTARQNATGVTRDLLNAFPCPLAPLSPTTRRAPPTVPISPIRSR